MARSQTSDMVDRVRNAWTAQPSVREVRMFGGLSFMVDDRMIVSVRADSDLLIRADPERTDELLTVKGARPAEMGRGRAMKGGWISVAAEAVQADEDFAFWLGVALDYHARQTGAAGRNRPR